MAHRSCASRARGQSTLTRGLSDPLQTPVAWQRVLLPRSRKPSGMITRGLHRVDRELVAKVRKAVQTQCQRLPTQSQAPGREHAIKRAGRSTIG